MTRYVALLRGVNVGGNNKVPMAELKAVFEQAGMRDVRTYINSGNVMFGADESDKSALTAALRDAILTHFDFEVGLLLLTRDELSAIVGALQDDWVNDGAMRCDVMFLWPAVDSPAALEEIPHDPAIEDVLYTPGAIIWRVDRTNVRKSRVPKIIGSPLYKQLTGRNCNTARKLLELLEG